MYPQNIKIMHSAHRNQIGGIRMSDDNDNRSLSLKLYVVLHHAFTAVQTEAFKDMKRYNLNPTEFAVLELLYNKGPQQVQQIGEKVLITSSSITYVVNNLVKNG